MYDEIKRRTAKRISMLAQDIIQGKTSSPEASRTYDLSLFGLVENGKVSSRNVVRANPQDTKEQYERRIKDLQEVYRKAMLELHMRKGSPSLLGGDDA
ncbi:transposase [Burkholderia cepacia]|uniref:transposase n=1 Tax=Burkholderia cepacia TaxID=292 RepID=UPI001CF2270B|nr:transposase [Burkholderia cepacia]MCA8355933.1 transposase [Burkholderia cepacia]